MTLVVDASVVVASLVDPGENGRWAARTITTDALLAPEMMLAEATNVLRRLEHQGVIDARLASLLHRDLLRMPVELVTFAPCAGRVWQLRSNVTAYDAWYVAVAELASAPLATLDRRLAAAVGPTCRFLTPA